LAPLQSIGDSNPKYLLTVDRDVNPVYDGIRKLNVLDWMLVGDQNGGITLVTGNGEAPPSDCQATVSSDWQSIEMSDRKAWIVAFIANNGKITSSQLAKLTGLTQGRVRTILQELTADGVIVKVGDNRYAGYVLKNNTWNTNA
jgi:hypothetical protein